jgi:stearoyl-CoA desaturase (delta-9 desaturase)
MFKMTPFWENFFYLLTYFTQGPSFLNPTTYAVMHRNHHAHSDTPGDPHSPIHAKNMWDMSLKTYGIYKKILKEHLDNEPGLNIQDVPSMPKLERFAETKMNVYLWIVVYLSMYGFIYYYFRPAWYYFLILPFHFWIGPIQGSIVNWCGHKIGYRNFDLPDHSRNSLPLDFALMGELYQNNHHRFAQNLNFAYRKFEIDFTYQLAKLLKLIRIIKIKPHSSSL